MLVRCDACAYIEELVELRLSPFFIAYESVGSWGVEVVCITISISARVCCAGGLDAFPLAGELVVWKGKDGG